MPNDWTDLEEGELVRYIPDHADGPNHEDSEVGEVVEVRREGALVDYNDGSPNAKFTLFSNLMRLGDVGSYKDKDPYV